MLTAVAMALTVLAGAVWLWHGHAQPLARVPVTDDAPERSLEEIDAAVKASQAFHDGLANEAKENWKKIHWAPSLDVALKTAQDVKKPVLVLLSVREIGTHDPGRC